MTDDVRKKDSMDISCSLVGQDKELRDLTKWDKSHWRALEREIISSDLHSLKTSVDKENAL